MNAGHDENLIAISADFHTSKRFWDFHKRYTDRLGGFVGIYDLIARMGAALDAWEATEKACYVDNGIDWIELVESYVGKFIETALAEDDPYFLPEPEKVLAETVKAIRQ